MNKNLTLPLASGLLAGLVLAGCEQPTTTAPAPAEPTAAAEPAAETDVGALVVEAEGAAAALVVEKSTDESDQAFIVTTGVQAVSATVVSYDATTREALLQREDGSQFNLTAREDTNNLEQVSPGDRLNVKVMEQVTLELVKGDNLRAFETNIDTERQAKAQEGAMPARAEIQQSIAVYTVEAIDMENNTFALKNVEGQVETFTAKNPANLAKAAVGDALMVKTVVSIAAEVVKAPAPEQES